MKNLIEAYRDEIKAGKCIVCKRTRRQYERLVDDIHHPKDGYIFDQARAERPIAFIERFCKHSKGEWAGQPRPREMFQKAFIRAL